MTEVQFGIRRHNTDQGHIREVMPLHNHLGSHQNIRLLCAEAFQNALSAVLPANGIRIHAKHARRGKHALGLLGELLGSHAEARNIR